MRYHWGLGVGHTGVINLPVDQHLGSKLVNAAARNPGHGLEDSLNEDSGDDSEPGPEEPSHSTTVGVHDESDFEEEEDLDSLCDSEDHNSLNQDGDGLSQASGSDEGMEEEYDSMYRTARFDSCTTTYD